MGGGYPGARAEKDVVARHCDKIRVFISSQEATHLDKYLSVRLFSFE